MTAALITIALLGAVAAVAALSYWTLQRVRTCTAASDRKRAAEQQACEAALGDLRRTAEQLKSQIEEIRQQPAVPLAPAPRPGFNLSTRSQALRMHRRGDSAPRIAAALDVPQQEVELLLKVHRIVMTSML